MLLNQRLIFISMSLEERSAVLLNLTGEQIARDVAKNLEPLIEKQVNKLLDQKSEDEESPLTMSEAADFLVLSRTTFSKIVGKGEIKFKSLNPNNPKAKKLFWKKDLRSWMEKNRNRTIDELKKVGYEEGNN